MIQITSNSGTICGACGAAAIRADVPEEIEGLGSECYQCSAVCTSTGPNPNGGKLYYWTGGATLRRIKQLQHQQNMADEIYHAGLDDGPADY